MFSHTFTVFSRFFNYLRSVRNVNSQNKYFLPVVVVAPSINGPSNAERIIEIGQGVLEVTAFT